MRRLVLTGAVLVACVCAAMCRPGGALAGTGGPMYEDVGPAAFKNAYQLSADDPVIERILAGDLAVGGDGTPILPPNLPDWWAAGETAGDIPDVVAGLGTAGTTVPVVAGGLAIGVLLGYGVDRYVLHINLDGSKIGTPTSVGTITGENPYPTAPPEPWRL